MPSKMIFQTQIPLKKQRNNQIDYQSQLLLIGSCFSENIGNKLSYYQFQANSNPLGILFHPKAIENLITVAVSKKTYTDKDVFFYNERWHSFETHSSLSNTDKNELINHLNSIANTTYNTIKEATHIIITLGTSWVYTHIDSKKTVANCHKVPQKEFSKHLLSVDTISENLKTITRLIRSINKNGSIIFTVSPVRHTKDGFIENTRSKSHLISAIHNSIKNTPNHFYFPSYEIMMDELRDYRFYKEDMIHPNKTAVTYIWEKFISTWFNEESLKTMQKVEEIQKGLAHKPFNPDSEAHKKFIKNIAQKKETLLQAFPFLNF